MKIIFNDFYPSFNGRRVEKALNIASSVIEILFNRKNAVKAELRRTISQITCRTPSEHIFFEILNISFDNLTKFLGLNKT